MSLVESWPSTRAAVEGALDARRRAADRRSAALQRRVGLHEAQHRREARRDHARALALGAEAHRARRAARPRGWRASRTRRSSGSPAGSRRRRRGAAAPRGSSMPLQRSRSTGSSVADHAGRGERDLARLDSPSASAAAPCVLAASSRPRSPVAALAQPELASTARSASRLAALAAHQHRRGGRAGRGEARGADRVLGASQTSRPRSVLPLGLIPQADAGGAEAGGQARVGLQFAHVRRARDPARAEERAAADRSPAARRHAAAHAAPRSRAGRTSG